MSDHDVSVKYLPSKVETPSMDLIHAAIADREGVTHETCDVTGPDTSTEHI